MAKKPSILDQLNAICDEVLEDSKKAREAFDQSEEKMLQYVEKFIRKLEKTHSRAIQKYMKITGNCRIYLPIRTVKSGEYNYVLGLFLDAHTVPWFSHSTSGTTEQIVLKLTNDKHSGNTRLDEHTILSLNGNDLSKNVNRYIVNREDPNFNECLATLVRYIKTKTFEADFVNKVAEACKSKLNQNAELVKTANRNNKI